MTEIKKDEEKRKASIRIISIDDEDYPARLKLISDPPEKLYYTGDIRLASRKNAAIVGSRKATLYGEETARKLGSMLSQAGIPVVSGLARGIDSAGHKGALEGPGGTVAVMGCGIDICYPAGNRHLWEKIRNSGLIISEYPPGTKAAKYMFPQRNRIISGISSAVVIVEAGIHSGSLITAELAAEQGRTVYSVPGNIDRVSSFGANKLIRDGAVPLILATDLLEDLGGKPPVPCEEDDERYASLGADEKKIIDAVTRCGEMTVDQLCAFLHMEPWTVNGMITVLEMKGLVHVDMGRVFRDI